MSEPTILGKGANTPVTSPSVLLTLTWQGGSTLDVSGLLLASNGKVRNDDDFVFYNQPTHASGAVTHRGGGPGSDALAVDLATLPTEIEKVVVAASADTGTFGDLTHLELVVSDAATGTDLVRFADMGASSETAFVVGELYRRNGAWKFRAVGQGWASGLAGLATDYGISVAEAEPESPQPASPDAVPPPPSAAMPPPPPAPGTVPH
ncbi:MAG: TerD family protein, partial [Nocardioides sp.]|nr:TerD family protein [Nocardioides sp.]